VVFYFFKEASFCLSAIYLKSFSELSAQYSLGVSILFFFWSGPIFVRESLKTREVISASIPYFAKFIMMIVKIICDIT